MSDVTRILSQIESGDPSAAEQLLPLVYEELRKLAAAKPMSKRRQRAMTPLKGLPCVSIAAASPLAMAILVSFGLWWRAPNRTDAPPAFPSHLASVISERR